MNIYISLVRLLCRYNIARDGFLWTHIMRAYTRERTRFAYVFNLSVLHCSGGLARQKTKKSYSNIVCMCSLLFFFRMKDNRFWLCCYGQCGLEVIVCVFAVDVR